MPMDERIPLIAGRPRITPLPKIPLFVTFAVRLAEAVTFTVAIPFLSFMLVDTGVALPTEVGYYAGLVEGIFPFAEFLTVVSWNRLSLRVGKRPVVLTALFAVGAAATCFGLSTSLWQMLFARCMAGGLNGNIAVMKAYLLEMTDDSNRALALSVDTLSWTAGSVIGPALGAGLSRPHLHYPGSVIGEIALFKRYPYLLPYSDTGQKNRSTFNTVPTPLEAHKNIDSVSRTTGDSTQSIGEYLAHSDTNASSFTIPAISEVHECDQEAQSIVTDAEAPEDLSAKTLLTPQITLQLAMCPLFALCATAFFATQPLFLFTPIENGGMGLNEQEIGGLISASQITSLLVIQMFLYPAVQARFSPLVLYRTSTCIYSLLFPALWALTFLAEAPRAIVYGAILIVQAFLTCANTGFSSSTLLLLASSPSQAAFSVINAWAMAAICAMRGLAMPVSTIIFAYGVDNGILGGYLMQAFMTVASLATVSMAFRLREPEKKALEECEVGS